MRVRIPWIVCWYAGWSVLTYGFYAWDKHRARVSAWRVKETTLHLLELLGGWPGAWIAQRRLHHKWKKASYVFAFRVIIAIHAVAWSIWIYFSAR